jgi:hypothetical protein
MNNIFKSLLVFAPILLMLSCQKKDNTPADLSKVLVTFATPATQQVYHTGDTININANVTYASEIIGIGLQIIDTAKDSVLYDEDHDLHTDHFALSGSWINELSDSTTLELKVTVFVANSAEKAERTIYFISKP